MLVRLRQANKIESPNRGVPRPVSFPWLVRWKKRKCNYESHPLGRSNIQNKLTNMLNEPLLETCCSLATLEIFNQRKVGSIFENLASSEQGPI